MLVCDLSRATEHCCASVGLFSFQCCTSLSHGTLADETVAHCLKTRALKKSYSEHAHARKSIHTHSFIIR